MQICKDRKGKFKSCLIQQEPYLLEDYKHIELNPVRAERVKIHKESPTCRLEAGERLISL